MPVIPQSGAPGANVKTLNDLIEETRSHLIGNAQDRFNLLAADCTAGATSLGMTYDVGLVGDGVRIDVGTEVMYVWSADSSNKSLTVRRGDSGSHATTHSAGDLVRINPRWTSWRILQAINAEILGLSSSGLYRMANTRIAFATTASTYALPADCTEVYSVTVLRSLARDPLDLWRMEIDPTFTTGRCLHVDPTCLLGGDVLYVTYRAPLNTLEDFLSVSAADTTGLAESALDIVPMGAAIRLDAGQAIERTDYSSIGDTAGSDAVRTSDELNAMNGLRALRRERIAEEKRALRRLWPPIGAH